MRKRYTKEFKQQIVAKYETGIGVTALCSEFSLSRSIVYKWISIFKIRKEKNVIFTYSDFLDLNKKYEKIQLELKIFKKTNCLPTSPLREKLVAMEEIFGQFPVKTMCRVLNVDHSTFYNHHFRRVIKTQYKINDEFLKPKIKEVFEKSKQRFGARKIRQKLKEQNITASVLKVTQLMQVIGLTARLAKQKPFFPKLNNKYLKNELKRDLTKTHLIKLGLVI